MRTVLHRRGLLANPSKSRRRLIKATPLFVAEALESRMLLSAVINSVHIQGPISDPTITVSGSGFGTMPATAGSVGGTGADFVGKSLCFQDAAGLSPNPWEAGSAGDGNYIWLGRIVLHG